MKTFSILENIDLSDFIEFAEEHFADFADGFQLICDLLKVNETMTVIYCYDSHCDLEEFLTLEGYLWKYMPDVFSGVQEPERPWIEEGRICCIADFGCSGVYLPATVEDLERAFFE